MKFNCKFSRVILKSLKRRNFRLLYTKGIFNAFEFVDRFLDILLKNADSFLKVSLVLFIFNYL